MIETLLLILALSLLVRALIREFFVRRPATGALALLAIIAALHPDIAARYAEPIATLSIMILGFWFILTPFRSRVRNCNRHHHHDC